MKLGNVITTVGFLVILFLFGATTLLKEHREVSKFENRVLAEKPALNKEDLLSGKYFKDYETYFSDQFLLRDRWVKTFTMAQVLQNKTYVNGYHITDNGWILGKPMEGLASNDLEASAKNLKGLSESLEEQGSKLLFAPFPAKVVETANLLPSYVSHGTGRENYQYLINELKTLKVDTLDMSAMWNEQYRPEELKNFYMKTDHHWNMDGAFEGYQDLIGYVAEQYPDVSKDFQKENYQYECVKNKKFVGSWNRSLYEIVDTTIDDFCYYHPATYDFQDYEVYKGEIKTENRVKEIGDLYATGLKEHAKEFDYHTAYADNYAELNIVNNKSSNNLKVLILKDSYTNPIILHLAHHFHQTTIFDSRYNEQSVNDYIKEQEFDLVIITYNTNNLRGAMYDFSKSAKK